MRSLLFSIDHVYKEDGTLTPLELNTATSTDFPIARLTVDNFTSSVDGFYDHVALHNFMSSSNFTKLDLIGVPSACKYFEVFAGYYGYEYTNHATLPTDVTVPYVEDADDKLIIRQAYNTYALVDDLYARDNFEFLNLIKSESFASPVTFVTQSFDTISSFESAQSSSFPNYVIKARYPEYNATDYPKLYELETEAQLNSLKSSLGSNEFIQKFEFNTHSGIENNRVRYLRSINLAIGDDLSQVLNISNYSKANALSLNNDYLISSSFKDSNNQLTPINASKFYPTWYVRVGKNYHNDENDFVLDQTGSLLDFDDATVGKVLKGVTFNGQLGDHLSGSLADLGHHTYLSSSIVAKAENTQGGIFVNISASNSNISCSWHDGWGNMYLTYRNGDIVVNGAELGYVKGGDTLVGDEIYIFNNTTGEFETITITSKTYEFKPTTTATLTIDPGSQFFVKIQEPSNTYYLLQHNACFSNCLEATATCGAACSECGKSSKFCVNCGGDSTTMCTSK